MNSYVVHRILQVGTRQLLLVQPDSYSFNLAVYDEHSGQTLMRIADCTLEQFKAAIALLEAHNDV